MTPEDLVEIELIKRLKYRYMRCLDQKLWDELAIVLHRGRHRRVQRRPLLRSRVATRSLAWLAEDDGLRGLPVVATASTIRRSTSPGPTAAIGTWALEDIVMIEEFGFALRGAAFYTDEYVKQDGEWKIRSTGYKRTFEEVFTRGDVPSLRLTASWWGTGRPQRAARLTPAAAQAA